MALYLLLILTNLESFLQIPKDEVNLVLPLLHCVHPVSTERYLLQLLSKIAELGWLESLFSEPHGDTS